MIFKAEAYSIVLQAAESSLHRDQPLPAADAVYGFLVALLQDAALDHCGNLWKQVAVGPLGEVAAIPLRRAYSHRILGLRPRPIALAVELATCYVHLVPGHLRRWIRTGLHEVRLEVKQVAVAVDLPQDLVVLR